MYNRCIASLLSAQPLKLPKARLPFKWDKAKSKPRQHNKRIRQGKINLFNAYILFKGFIDTPNAKSQKEIYPNTREYKSCNQAKKWKRNEQEDIKELDIDDSQDKKN